MYDFTNKRYTTWADERSGIRGKYRPTTYGVYDNKLQLIHCNSSSYEEAESTAIQLNTVEEQASKDVVYKHDNVTITFNPRINQCTIDIDHGSLTGHLLFYGNDVVSLLTVMTQIVTEHLPNSQS